jgi:hypothetical protein
MRKSKAAGPSVVFFILVASLAAGAQQPWKGKIYKDGDVTVVQNPKEPLYKGQVLALKEELSIGGANAKEPYVLADVDNLVVDETGTIYALDLKDLCVKAYDRSGKSLNDMR